MDRLGTFTHNYFQAPWRKQLSLIGLFLLALVVMAMVAYLYLSVSARTAQIGREIQFMQRRITELDRENEDLQSRLAILMSAEVMEDRAQSLGFLPVQTEEILYLSVPGYVERPSAILAPYTQRVAVSALVTPAEYTESLFEWLRRQLNRLTFTAQNSP